ncbi:hypothetical protein PFLU3_54890 [Pseudomonas fluorescens]|uniref:Uncharacterized protein n=1 Tax=Pseudomonas fluorescens TaxID=294 RepID=A0A0D0STM3_PSEFL|nr:hypothetical protein C4K02_2249 [Pseudomonas synxantha]KIR15406.1 hypothetical protein PFLU3_54890 [Pseudomonas fluorescens]
MFYRSILGNTHKNVGGGLLPIAVFQAQIQCLTFRYREQAPSHIKPCGAG